MKGDRTYLLPLMLGAVLGCALGWVLGRGTSGATERVADGPSPALPSENAGRDGSRTEDLSVPQDQRRSVSGSPTADAPTRSAPSREEADVGIPLIHEGLLTHGREGISRGWRAVRPDEIPGDLLEEGLDEYVRFVRDSPDSVGRRLGIRENDRDDARAAAVTGDPMALLRNLARTQGPLPDLVSDAEAFGQLFERIAPPRVVNAILYLEDPDEAIEDGVTLQYPDGVFALDNLMMDRKPIPRDVTIAGAGLDATLLVLGFMLPGDELQNFSIRDCTVFLRTGSLLIGNHPVTLQLERVRLIGFDMGEDSSVFVPHRMALRARDCRIEGGYGQRPGCGALFRSFTSASLARFEGCVLSLLSLDVHEKYALGTVVFHDCSLIDLLDPPEIDIEGKPGVMLRGTSVSYYDESRGDPPEKDLNDLFPDWEKRINQ